MAQDGFNKVQRKSRKAFKPIPLSQKLSDREEVLQKTGFLNEFDGAPHLDSLRLCCTSSLHVLFYVATWEQSREGVPTDLAPTRLVCLALGSFQQSWQTQHQLLLLCHLVQMLDVWQFAQLLTLMIKRLIDQEELRRSHLRTFQSQILSLNRKTLSI